MEIPHPHRQPSSAVSPRFSASFRVCVILQGRVIRSVRQDGQYPLLPIFTKSGWVTLICVALVLSSIRIFVDLDKYALFCWLLRACWDDFRGLCGGFEPKS
uniref:Uncharacterized protein n=1 Tax=Mus musculus TaxID=10090 RepID=Q8C808_MOUSE|nr:unnamed protein product [Mus musculus]